MPPSQFTPVWESLSDDLRSRLLHHPARALTPADVDELVQGGGRPVHALWFDTRAGRARGWSTSWQFQRFVELYRLSETVHGGRSPRRPAGGGVPRGGRRSIIG